jgi:hypothetical protein
MAIVGADEIFKKISSQVESQFPGFVREEGPRFVAFLKAYFEYMEQSGNAIKEARTLRDNKDIDRTVDSFVEYFRKEFMINIPKEVLADKRLLTKHIRDFYRTRGSQESYRFLFRALFNKEIEFYYPGDDILRASDGRWVQETRLRVASPSSINPRSFEGKRIRGINSGATAFVEDIIATEALGILVYDMTVRNVSGTFSDGERIVNIDNTNEFSTVSSQVGSIIDVSITDGGAFHNLGDSVEISGAGSTQVATGTVTEVTNRSAVTIKLVKAGSGYTKDNSKIIISGGNGFDFDAKIESFTSQSIAGLSINTDIINPMRNVPLNTPSFFVRRGANTARISTKLTGTVATSSVSNTVTGTGTNFVTQLKVGDIVRIFGVANTARVHSITNATSFVSAITPFQNISGANAYIGLAAANVSSRLISALTFSNTALFSINAITLINPGRGYNTTLPTIRIVDDFITRLNLSDGYGNLHGNNAVVLANNAPGTITKLRLVSAGSNFNKYDNANILNLTQSNAVFVETQSSSFANGTSSSRYLNRKKTFSALGQAKPSGFVSFPGRYIDTKGFLSWNNRLQDNFYYQEFSYVIRVSEMLNKYRNVIKSLVHPAGVKLFGDYIISSVANVNITVIDEAPSVVRGVVTESITATATHTATAVYTSGISVTEPVASVETTNATFNANTAATESVTSTEISNATFVASGPASESITSTDAPDATFNANTAIVETATSTEIVNATFDANTAIAETITVAATENATFNATGAITESVTSIDVQQGQRFTLMSGVFASVQYANNLIQTYATSQIAPYSGITVGAFDGTPRLVVSESASARFANGALRANTGSISLGGRGSNLYIITNPGTPNESSTVYNVNAIFSNTAFTIRTNFLPTSANTRIWYSTGP